MSTQTAASTSNAAVHATGAETVYESLFRKVNLTPVTSSSGLDRFTDNDKLSETSLDDRLTVAVNVLLESIQKSAQHVDRLDKALLDFHISRIDQLISAQLDEIMHKPEFQRVESAWRGLRHLVDRCDYRKNVKTELIDLSKDDIRQDFEDTPEIIQSGLYNHTYVQEYDQPGGEPFAAMVSAYEFDRSQQDLTLLRNLSKVAAASHCPFLGAVGPSFFGKETMQEVASIQDIGVYMERVEFTKWKSFRETDDARYIGLTLPSVLARLPYGSQTLPVRSFNYEEAVKGPDHTKYLWSNASFAMAANMVRSYVRNGWSVQIRGPRAGGLVEDLPIHLYDLGTGAQMKIPTEVLIPETREFEFANLGFIPLSFYKNRDYACFFSANSAQKPALYDTKEATANSRANSRLPYIMLISRLAHYLKVMQRENIGMTKDRKVLEAEFTKWIRGLVTEMNDPSDEVRAQFPLRDACVVVEDIEDNPGFFRVKLFVMPHFQIEGMDVSLSLVSQMPKDKK